MIAYLVFQLKESVVHGKRFSHAVNSPRVLLHFNEGPIYYKINFFMYLTFLTLSHYMLHLPNMLSVTNQLQQHDFVTSTLTTKGHIVLRDIPVVPTC